MARGISKNNHIIEQCGKVPHCSIGKRKKVGKILSLFALSVITLTLIGCRSKIQTDFSGTHLENEKVEKDNEDSSKIIEAEIDHSFPFTVHAFVNEPSYEHMNIVKIAKKDFTEKDILYLLNYFSYGREWKDKNGQLISEINNQVPFSAYYDTGETISSLRIISSNMFEFIKNKDVVVMREEFLSSFPEYVKDFKREPAISYEDALEITNKTMLDLEYVIDQKMKVLYGSRAIGYIGDIPQTFGWEFVITRTCNQLQVPYRSEYDLWENSDPPSAFSPWGSECVFIYIDENGLYKVDARGLGIQKEMTEETINLIPFSEAYQRIIEQLKMQHPDIYKGTSDWKVDITRIKLCIIMLNNKEDVIGYMTPAWEIEYNLEYSINGDKESYVQYTYIDATNGLYVEPRITENDFKLVYGD